MPGCFDALPSVPIFVQAFRICFCSYRLVCNQIKSLLLFFVEFDFVFYAFLFKFSLFYFRLFFCFFFVLNLVFFIFFLQKRIFGFICRTFQFQVFHSRYVQENSAKTTSTQIKMKIHKIFKNLDKCINQDNIVI